MKVNEITIAAIVGFICIILLITHWANSSRSSEGGHKHIDTDTFISLMNLIKVQNDTIHTLENHLKHRLHETHSQATTEEIKLIEISESLGRLSKESEMHQAEAAKCKNLSIELEHAFDNAIQQHRLEHIYESNAEHHADALQSNVVVASTSTFSEVPPAHHWPTSKMEDDCEVRYGMELAEKWRANEEVWCSNGEEAEDKKSELKCYPYHQAHKKLDGRGPDLFCVATNFVIDFSKV